jgi:hypothetical protein
MQRALTRTSAPISSSLSRIVLRVAAANSVCASPYSGGSFYLGSYFLLRQLQPSLTKKTATAFELPDDAFDGPLKLVIPQKGSIFKKKGNSFVELVKPGLTKAQAPAPKITEKPGNVRGRCAEINRVEGDAGLAASKGDIFPRTYLCAAARTSHRLGRRQERGPGRKILLSGSDGSPPMCSSI